MCHGAVLAPDTQEASAEDWLCQTAIAESGAVALLGRTPRTRLRGPKFARVDQMAHQNKFAQSIGVLLVIVGTAGCGASDSEQPTPNFGAEEMKAIVVGDFTGTLVTGTQSTPLKLHLDHAPPTEQAQCGTRALGMNVECIDTTSLGLLGSLSTDDGKFAATPVKGSFMVFGLEIKGGNLQLTLPQGVTLSANYANGKFDGCELRDAASSASTCTLTR